MEMQTNPSFRWNVCFPLHLVLIHCVEYCCQVLPAIIYLYAIIISVDNGVKIA